MNMIFIGELWLPQVNPPLTFNNLIFACERESLGVKAMLAVSIKRLIEEEIAGSWFNNRLDFKSTGTIQMFRSCNSLTLVSLNKKNCENFVSLHSITFFGKV
jgi:hypothetical protein